ncbi:MAG: hypothetical protein B7Z74_09435 [Deltaproteobacteria bacterium 21-66-5]|nr:MAG: hypothetical protein B7Z74_09435 [Deltaproteobacteria bacterium 21-66-5]
MLVTVHQLLLILGNQHGAVVDVGHEGIELILQRGHLFQHLEIGARDLVYDPDIAKVSIVGMAMRSHSGVALKVFETLAAEGINILGISTSEIKISVLIEEKYSELAVRVLHGAFGLGNPA